MRKLYWYFTAYSRKYGLVVILSIILASLFFSFIVPTIADSLDKHQRHYIGLVGEYSLSNLPSEISHQLSAGLTQIEEDGSASPLLSERWTVEQDGKVYRFLLKENLYWQDGEPFSPQDVRFNLREVEIVVTPNDIVFKLPDAYAPFPVIMAEPLFKEGVLSQWRFFSRPTLIGIGPYQLIDYTLKGNRLAEAVVDGPNERFIYRFYLTENDAVNAFKRGEVDILPELSSAFDIMEWPTVDTTETINYNRYLALFFNVEQPTFSRNVRQALSYALELAPEEKRALGPISPDSWAYFEGARVYHRDWDRGVERLIDDPPPEKIDIVLTSTSLFQDEAIRIKDEWEEFGAYAHSQCLENDDVDDKDICDRFLISVRLHITNFPDTSNFQVLLVGQESPPDPDQYHLWHSEQPTNFTGYKNTRIDNLLEQGRQTINQQERREIYQEFQQFFLEDPPAIFLHHLINYHVERR